MITRTVLALAVAAAVAAPSMVHAKDTTDLTVYRSDNNSLFSSSHSGAVDAGHAVVHEQRQLRLQSGSHDVTVGDLPDFLDPEAVHLGFDSSKNTVVSQRLLLPRGDNGALSGQIGKSVTVLGGNGEQLIKGTLVQVNGDGSLVIGGDVFGPTVVRKYAAVKLTGGHVGGGARLQLRVHAASSGTAQARLTYPTSGLGWRGAYTGLLQSGSGCHLKVTAMASIANRSGRDWTNTSIKLIAGSPNFSKDHAPRPMMMKAMSANAQAMPQQHSLGDYKAYTLPEAVTLPKGSITLSPLYKPHTVTCHRTWLFENGNRGYPSRPITRDSDSGTHKGPVVSKLAFTAFDSFPAGYLRVLTLDHDGNAEFLGEGSISDTPKGQNVELTLGNAFDLTATRTRTQFHVDKRQHTMDESFRIKIDNAGNTARAVTVREHPWRWSNWKLTSSSIQPEQKTPDKLEFQVKVPAGKNTTLNYTVHYSWTAADE